MGCHGGREVLGLLRRCERVFLSFLCMAELRPGFALGGKPISDRLPGSAIAR